MKKILLSILILTFALPALLAHPWKPAHYIIIDTDGGMDDFRAISMLLASPDVRVLGITVTPGALAGTNAYNQVQSMLKSYYHNGLLVGLNDAPEIKPANFPMAVKFQWGSRELTDEKPVAATEILKYIYQNSTDPIYFVCLGSLNIVDKASKVIPQFNSRTASILWSCSDFSVNESFNYSLDKEAYKKVSKLKIPVLIVNGKSIRQEIFNDTLVQQLGGLNIPYANEINRSLQTEHKMIYDEAVPLWLHFPKYFETTVNGQVVLTSINASISDEELQKAVVQITAGETINMNQVINFSWRKEDYFQDIQPIMDSTVKKYGKAEWEAEIMANELHRHLGVFAIVGAKMGIRAKEYFGAGIDEITVNSYAGSIPPFSCMNDGLQVSTGATVGHGLIKVSPDTTVRPVADFTYMGRTIRVTLKPEFGKKIASEVKELNTVYGLNSNIYWELIRRLAIKYWANFDRHEVFTIEEVN